MTNHADHSPKAPIEGSGMVVRRPRPTDDIGAALSSAFGVRRVLPGDLAAMLSRLDAIG